MFEAPDPRGKPRLWVPGRKPPSPSRPRTAAATAFTARVLQLQLDVAEFGREASQLGVDLASSEVFIRLKEVVEATAS